MESTQITDFLDGEELRFAVAYGSIDTVPISIALGIFGCIIGYFKN